MCVNDAMKLFSFWASGIGGEKRSRETEEGKRGGGGKETKELARTEEGESETCSFKFSWQLDRRGGWGGE